MKKVALLFICAFGFLSCDMEDDGPTTSFAYSEVVSVDLPEYFEKDETYDIEVTYLLPSACHTKQGIRAERGGITGKDRRNIYIIGFSAYDTGLTDCPETEESLTRTGTFTLTIDEEEPYTFYLWKGVDLDEKPIYESLEIPVGEPEPETPEVESGS